MAYDRSKGARFYSGRAIPIGTTLTVEEMGPLVIVHGSVPGGSHVTCYPAVVDGQIVLDDALFFEHETSKLKLR